MPCHHTLLLQYIHKIYPNPSRRDRLPLLYDHVYICPPPQKKIPGGANVFAKNALAFAHKKTHQNLPFCKWNVRRPGVGGYSPSLLVQQRMFMSSLLLNLWKYCHFVSSDIISPSCQAFSKSVTQNNCSWPQCHSCFAFLFFFSSQAMDAVLIYRTLTHTRLYYDSLGRIHCPSTKMSATKNLYIPKSTWIDHWL